MIYQVHHARGSLWARQQAANKAGCQAYCEQHLNSIGGDNRRHINYAMAICDANASEASKDWARTYTRVVSETFGHPDRGVLVYPGRGSYNVRFLKCPAILLEPGFISCPEFADVIRTGEGIDALAGCLVKSIRLCFPEPSAGLIGLSAGHAYRDKPDPGAPVYDKGQADTDPKFDDETELNIAIVDAAAEMLTTGFDPRPTEPSPPPESERQS